MPDASHPAVSVIVPCRNEVGYIGAALRSVLSQEPPDGGFEVIVADGLSDDGTRDVLSRMEAEAPGLRIVDNPERIVSTGLNRAIGVARGGIVVRMDAHTEYAPDYLRQCVAVLGETGADNVGGAARTQPHGYVQKAVAAAYHSPFSVGGAKFHDADFEGYLDTVTYGCWRREAFARYGLFDEKLVRNQDDEHNLRIVRGGGRIWQSRRIRSWYAPRSSLRALFRQYYQYGYWKVNVIRKHRLPASVRHLVPGLFVAGLLVCLLGSPFSAVLRGLGLAAAGAYAAGLLAASLLTAARTEWRLAPILPAVFAAYHFGYGLGFMHGLLDFGVLKRAPRASATILTRGP